MVGRSALGARTIALAGAAALAVLAACTSQSGIVDARPEALPADAAAGIEVPAQRPGCTGAACLTCSTATCENGCCLNDTCLPGNSPNACGFNGTVCVTCLGNEFCDPVARFCTPTTPLLSLPPETPIPDGPHPDLSP